MIILMYDKKNKTKPVFTDYEPALDLYACQKLDCPCSGS